MVDYIKVRFPHRPKSCLRRHYCNYSWAELSTSVRFIWNLLASEKQQRILSLSPIKSNSIMLIGLSGIWEQSIISPGRWGDNVPLVFTFLYLTNQRRLTPSQEINQMTRMGNPANSLSFTWSYNLSFFFFNILGSRVANLASPKKQASHV